MSTGLPFETLIKDLNILNVRSEDYVLTAKLNDGGVLKRVCCIDMFADEEQEVEFRDEMGYDLNVVFNPCGCVYDYASGGIKIAGEAIIKVDWDTEYYLRYAENNPEKAEKIRNREKRKIVEIVATRKLSKELHYAV